MGGTHPRSSHLLALLLIVVCFIHSSSSAARRPQKPHLPQTNLLFIIFDDLRPELSVYGKSHMITPNFERLAKRSVVFDTALCQVAVCNPSRNSLLTGLRPDATSGYNFQKAYQTKIFPEHLISAGYKTAGYGKIRHWDGPDKNLWTEDQFDGPLQPNGKIDGKYMNWYEYQDYEWRSMNSSVMPDKSKPLDTYPDAELARRASDRIRKFANGANYWMTAVGFKMPHLSLHVPHKYWDMYADKEDVWRKADDSIRSFPQNAPPVSYRCCADKNWKYMDQEGGGKASKFEVLGRLNKTLSSDMYVESQRGYAAAITYVDEQLGKLLDVLDELQVRQI